MSYEDNELKTLIKNLVDKVNQQNGKLEKLQSRLEKIEKNSEDGDRNYLKPPPPPQPSYLKNTNNKNKESVPAMSMGDKQRKSAEEETVVFFKDPQPKEKKSVGQWEEAVGGQLFLKIGVVAFVLGIAFLLKYSFDNNWVGPTGRILIGIFTGLAFLAIGEKTIRKTFAYAQAITGAGLTVLYLSFYVALNSYHLLTPEVSFFAMTVITGIGIALSLRYDAPYLIVYSVIGGFATPFLVSSGENQQFILFSYVTLLDLSVLSVSVFKNWRWLNLSGFIGTIFVFLLWYGHFYSPDQLAPTLFFATVFFVLYSISSLIYNLVQKKLSLGFEQLITLFGAFIYFAFAYALLNYHFAFLQGIFTTFLALYYFLWAYAVKEITPDDNNMYNFLAFLSITFITVALAVQFNAYIITIVWSIEAVLLIVLGATLKEKTAIPIKLLGLVIMAMAFVRVLWIDKGNYDGNFLFLLNPQFLSAFVLIAGIYVATFFLSRQKSVIDKEVGRLNKYNKQIIAGMLIAASLATLSAVLADIGHYYENKIEQRTEHIESFNRAQRIQYGNRKELTRKVDPQFLIQNREKKNMTAILFILFYSIILLAISVYKVYLPLIWTSFFGLAKAEFGIFCILIFDLSTPLRQVSFVFGIIVSYIAAILLLALRKRDKDSQKFARNFLAVFLIAASIFTILAGSREITAHYSKKISVQNMTIRKVCHNRLPKKNYTPYSAGNYKNSDINTSVCLESQKQLKNLQSRSSTAISIFWLLYAILLLLIGFGRQNKWLRLVGITLLLIAIFKLFFVDLWSLGQLYRIIASIVLGVVLLGISFVYQRRKSSFKELIDD